MGMKHEFGGVIDDENFAKKRAHSIKAGKT